MPAPTKRNNMAFALETLPRKTAMVRVFSQPISASDRTLAFNPNSIGRASPVYQHGKVMPAMYVAIDSAQCALREFLFHFVVKKFPHGGVVSKDNFALVRIAQLETTQAIELLSVVRLVESKWPRAHRFTDQSADYSETLEICQQACDMHPTCSGLAWVSARAPAVGTAAVLYEQRVPAQVLRVREHAHPLVERRDLWDYAQSYLADEGVLVGIGLP
jgi:RES domain